MEVDKSQCRCRRFARRDSQNECFVRQSLHRLLMSWLPIIVPKSFENYIVIFECVLVDFVMGKHLLHLGIDTLLRSAIAVL